MSTRILSLYLYILLAIVALLLIYGCDQKDEPRKTRIVDAVVDLCSDPEFAKKCKEKNERD